MTEDLITTAQAAEILGVSAARVRQLIGEGRLEAVKLGRDLFVKKEDVIHFAAEPRVRTGRPSNKS